MGGRQILKSGKRCGGSSVRLEVPGGGWAGRRFQLGTNKEVFEAEAFAIWQALRALEQRGESGRRYTIFVDPTSAIARVHDARGLGQRFGVAAIGVESRLTSGRRNGGHHPLGPGSRWGRGWRGGRSICKGRRHRQSP